MIIDLTKKKSGKVVCTGMGKAGIIMRKFSATLSSLGIPSVYMHPGEALHGDLGMLQQNDILFVASTSGKTREIIEVIDLSKKRNVTEIIGITSHVDSPIRLMAKVVIDMGTVIEAGDLQLTPTTSTLVMLSLLDTLAIVVSEEIGFSTKDYAVLHHAGYLGDVLRGIEKGKKVDSKEQS